MTFYKGFHLNFYSRHVLTSLYCEKAQCSYGTGKENSAEHRLGFLSFSVSTILEYIDLDALVYLTYSKYCSYTSSPAAPCRHFLVTSCSSVVLIYIKKRSNSFRIQMKSMKFLDRSFMVKVFYLQSLLVILSNPGIHCLQGYSVAFET